MVSCPDCLFSQSFQARIKLYAKSELGCSHKLLSLYDLNNIVATISGLNCQRGSKSQLTHVAIPTGLTPVVGIIIVQTRLILLARILQ